jgi:mRNA interferase MazF
MIIEPYKNFDEWSISKKNTELKGRPKVKEGEIWWCRIGLNIGVEEDGKNKNFRRPVLILKKYSDEIVFVVPLSTQTKDSNWYFNFIFKSKNQVAILNQAKPVDTKRLDQYMGNLNNNTHKEIKNKFITLIQE